MTQADIKRFFGAIKARRDRALFGVMYFYGLRIRAPHGNALFTTREGTITKRRIEQLFRQYLPFIEAEVQSVENPERAW